MTTIAGDRQLELVCSTLVLLLSINNWQSIANWAAQVYPEFVWSYFELSRIYLEFIQSYPGLSRVKPGEFVCFVCFVVSTWNRLFWKKTLFSLKQLSIESRNFLQNYRMFVWLNDRRRQYFVSLSSSEFPHWWCLRISKYSRWLCCVWTLPKAKLLVRWRILHWIFEFSHCQLHSITRQSHAHLRIFFVRTSLTA